MIVRAALILCFLLLSVRAHADSDPCGAAAAAAEQETGLPAGLLLAIGQQESGRWDAAAGKVLAWPFAINAAGESRFFPTVAEAVDYVRSRQRAGIQSIDTGCFQINLLAHPYAFGTLNEAFEPVANARYAAGFLKLLYSQTGSWEAAVGRYHSATSGLGEPYRDAVYSRWKDRRPSAAIVQTGSTMELIAGVMVQRPSRSAAAPETMAGPINLPHVIVPGNAGFTRRL